MRGKREESERGRDRILKPRGQEETREDETGAAKMAGLFREEKLEGRRPAQSLG